MTFKNILKYKTPLLCCNIISQCYNFFCISQTSQCILNTTPFHVPCYSSFLLILCLFVDWDSQMCAKVCSVHICFEGIFVGLDNQHSAPDYSTVQPSLPTAKLHAGTVYSWKNRNGLVSQRYRQPLSRGQRMANDHYFLRDIKYTLSSSITFLLSTPQSNKISYICRVM